MFSTDEPPPGAMYPGQPTVSELLEALHSMQDELSETLKLLKSADEDTTKYANLVCTTARDLTGLKRENEDLSTQVRILIDSRKEKQKTFVSENNVLSASFLDNEPRCLFYTGLPNKRILLWAFNLVKEIE